MIDNALAADRILALLQHSGHAEYTVDEFPDADSLVKAVENTAKAAGLTVKVRREGRSVIVDAVPHA